MVFAEKGDRPSICRVHFLSFFTVPYRCCSRHQTCNSPGLRVETRATGRDRHLAKARPLVLSSILRGAEPIGPLALLTDRALLCAQQEDKDRAGPWGSPVYVWGSPDPQLGAHLCLMASNSRRAERSSRHIRVTVSWSSLPCPTTGFNSEKRLNSRDALSLEFLV